MRENPKKNQGFRRGMDTEPAGCTQAKKCKRTLGFALWVRLHANLVEPANIWYTRHVADSFAMEGGESHGYRRIFRPFGFGWCDLVLHLQMAG